MPVTKTAKRALRGSKKKEEVNKRLVANLEAAMRVAKSKKGSKNVLAAISLTDRAAKKHVIHKNKAARIKRSLGKLLPKTKTTKTSKKR
ncbi:MAG: 30S ribosomal protein S20 [Patescibacteria group bacterium]